MHQMMKRLADARRETASLRSRDGQHDVVRMLEVMVELMELWSEPGKERAFLAAWRVWSHYRARLGGREPRGRRRRSRPRAARGKRAATSAARRDVEAFKTGNRHQVELKTLLIRILDHLRRECCEPEQAAFFEHWRAVFRVYRRVLGEPEMATRQAHAVLAQLLDLEAGDLTERRLEFVLGRRKAKKAAAVKSPIGIRIRR